MNRFWEFVAHYFWQLLGALVILVLVAYLLSGCGMVPPAPESDSNQKYAAGSSIPVDPNYYTVKGTVVGDISEKTTGQKPTTMSGSAIVSGGSFAYASGSVFPGDISGKGFVRLAIEQITPDTDITKSGDVTLLKTSDTKAIALLPGDVVTFICRAQYEAVAATIEGERFDRELAGTWELDYCRLKSPVLHEGDE